MDEFEEKNEATEPSSGQEIAAGEPFQKPDLTRRLTDEEIDKLRELTKKEKVYEIFLSLFDADVDDEVDYWFYQTMPNNGTIAHYTRKFSDNVGKASNIMMFDTSLNDRAALDKLVKKYPNVGIMITNQLNKLTGIGGDATIKKR